MAYKCKVCGYKFKSSDSDLCPECFTARDDINCTDIDGHTHKKDMPRRPDEEDFLYKQIMEEKDISRELEERRRKANKKYPDPPRPQSNVTAGYDPSRFSSHNASQVKNAAQVPASSFKTYKSSTTTYNSSASNISAYEQYKRLTNSYNTGGSTNNASQDRSARMVKRFVIIIVFFIIISTVLSVIIPIAGVLMAAVNGKNESENSLDSMYADYEKIETSEEDYSFVDVTNIRVDGVYDNADEITGSETPQYVNIMDENQLEDGKWLKAYVDVSLDDVTSLIDGVVADAFDEDYNMLYSVIPNVTGSANPLNEVQIPVNESIDNMTIVVYYHDPAIGEQVSTQIEIPISEFLAAYERGE